MANGASQQAWPVCRPGPHSPHPPPGWASADTIQRGRQNLSDSQNSDDFASLNQRRTEAVSASQPACSRHGMGQWSAQGSRGQGSRSQSPSVPRGLSEKAAVNELLPFAFEPETCQ